MKTRTKSALVLLGTLLIGIVIGIMAWSTVHNRQLERTRSLRSRGALEDVIVHAVSPLSSEKEAEIREIVSGVADELNELFREAFEVRTRKLDSMLVQLDQVLSPEERARLEAWRERNSRSSRSRSRRDSSAHQAGRDSSDYQGSRRDSSSHDGRRKGTSSKDDDHDKRPDQD